MVYAWTMHVALVALVLGAWAAGGLAYGSTARAATLVAVLALAAAGGWALSGAVAAGGDPESLRLAGHPPPGAADGPAGGAAPPLAATRFPAGDGGRLPGPAGRPRVAARHGPIVGPGAPVPLTRYLDFVLLADQVKVREGRLASFVVRVF